MFKRWSFAATLSQHASQHSERWRALLLGQQCAACEQACAGSPVCQDCLQLCMLPVPRCPQCAVPQGRAALCGACISRPPSFDASLCVGTFKPPLSGLVSQLKFNQRLTLAPWFAQQLDMRIQGLAIDLIVPVPLFETRLSERGFNQSWEIAKRLQHPAPKAHALMRLRDTPSQRSVTASQRFANVRGAFAADASVKDLHVLLIDDVVTTTATVLAASKALKAAGAAKVTVACIARVAD